MPVDKFNNQRNRPGEGDLKKKIGKPYQRLEEAITTIESLHKDIASDWKYSNTSGWYLTYNKKKKRLFYLFPRENDFTLKIVFNEKSLKMIRERPFPEFVHKMLSIAKKYPEGTLLVFNKDNFNGDAVLELLKIKIES